MAENESRSGRNGRWWQDYAVRGMTMEAIAQRDGVDKSTVCRAIQQVRDSIPEQKREEVRAEVIDALRYIRAESIKIAELLPAPVTAGKDGVPLYDPDTGALVRDYSGRLAAYRTVMDTLDRERKLLGLDEAARVKVETGEDEAARRLAADSAAYLNQDQDQA